MLPGCFFANSSCRPTDCSLNNLKSQPSRPPQACLTNRLKSIFTTTTTLNQRNKWIFVICNSFIVTLEILGFSKHFEKISIFRCSYTSKNGRLARETFYSDIYNLPVKPGFLANCNFFRHDFLFGFKYFKKLRQYNRLPLNLDIINRFIYCYNNVKKKIQK